MDWIGIVVRLRGFIYFCVIVVVALAMQLDGGIEDGLGWAEVGLDVQEQLHSPVGQAQELPQLQVHPGPIAPRKCGVS